MSALVIRNLSKKFNNIWAVKNLNLELKPGEIFVLLGPNGAGKTTTLKLIAGLLKPTTGDIYIKGIDLKKEPERAKGLLGFVPDEPYIYNKLTGREFLNFVGSIFDVSQEDYKKMLPHLLEKFEIGRWIDDLAESYSHGMRQKIIMCQLLLHNPEVILIDEPLVGLDPKVSKTVRETFIQLMRENKTLLVSTHTLSFAREIATRIGIINHGELKFVGTVEELSKIAGEEDIEEIYLKLSEAS
uniref:ABC transporter ATP-binding protein n=1 Tax=candidate division WOR-3 bacterium TaxID=2052148 RepID=A0A7C4XFT8_UNCW3